VKIAQIVAKDNEISLDTYLQANSLFREAYGHLERQEWKEAVEGFREVLKLDKKCVQAHGNMGMCLGALGRKAEALEELDRALELDPDYEPAIRNRRIMEGTEEGKPLRDFAYANTEYYKEKILRELAAEEEKKEKNFSLRRSPSID
jgi:tetratricopeptide (TPR) repeat protein